MSKVVIRNDTGIPTDTKVFIDGAEVPHNKLMGVDIRIRPGEFVTASVELLVDVVDVSNADLIEIEGDDGDGPENPTN